MPSDILAVLRQRGRLGAGTLVGTLGISRATLMRAIRGAGEQIVTLGRARRTTYAARRLLRGSAIPLPLYQVNAEGDVLEIGRIHLTSPPFSTALERLHELEWPLDRDLQEGWFDGLPYPLYDMRPQGFLGRHFAIRYGEQLRVSSNPEHWTDDDVLYALSMLGEDTVGNLIVGETSCSRWLAHVTRIKSGGPVDAISDEAVTATYPQLAQTAMAEGLPGSSAGGEFPKFTALRRKRLTGELHHVLVKFSGSDGSEGTQRWADLLICEHWALETLRSKLGIAAARTTLYRAGGRVFLEVERFDRQGALGRSALVSWAALNGAFFGVAGKHWGEVSRLLRGRGWLDEQDGVRLETLGFFGELIANSDMHDGNLSFVPSSKGVCLAPAYDMLPMLYAPHKGVELPSKTYAPRLPLPSQKAAWTDASRAAVAFWQTASGDERISARFRAICAENALRLQTLISA
ncbi:MAG: type II toxin-antitoxin system HipA family toxin YjjJ [Burkholderiaceae bacterium]|nr:type II toxin-antitoxin system HipA family toxin YjjJ [Burkholderiaceae bacterium]